MASFKNTLKHGLLEYPTIFPNPIDVCIHLFCVIGNGYEWYNGQLVDRHARIKRLKGGYKDMKMKYPFKEESEFDKRFGHRKDVSSIYTEHKLQDEASLVQMQFVEKNIDKILESSPVATYFGGSQTGHFFTKGISVQYADAFSFPDNIKKDWAKALYTFLDHWLIQLNREYGVDKSNEHDNYSHWPTDAKEARLAIWKARIRLHPIVYNGQTYAEHVTKMHELFSSFKNLKLDKQLG